MIVTHPNSTPDSSQACYPGIEGMALPWVAFTHSHCLPTQPRQTGQPNPPQLLSPFPCPSHRAKAMLLNQTHPTLRIICTRRWILRFTCQRRLSVQARGRFISEMIWRWRHILILGSLRRRPSPRCRPLGILPGGRI
jgi:hypothetical protein